MGTPEVIDLSSDEETDLARVTVKQEKVFVKHEFEEKIHTNLVNGVQQSICMTDQASLYANRFSRGSASSGSSIPICRQFWKSGDYEVRQALRPSSCGPGRLRINPKFLHSNATSHKWAFGAIAELLDNAVDEVQKGATRVIIDKFVNPRNGDPALLIQDDGSGMDPESLRRCLSFGFSDKQSDACIGQYGNGFKTSTMRLGADVIVFSRCTNGRVATQSIGLLSYTFLRETGCDDVVVPVVDYEFNPLTGVCGRPLQHDEKHRANLSTLLKWSPFSEEVELLNQFADIHHGTKIIVYNLWLNDDAGMELDFETDQKDIMINGADRNIPKKSVEHLLSKKYVANRLHYSLREYSSILYLHVPENFKIILRGEPVNHHHIAKDLIYPECIKYKPQVGGLIEGEILTTIGYLNGAPNVNVHGFNVYHKNRLILPFWNVAHNSYGKGRGVVGVLEANFIKPTHDKQDFEKSTLYQKLEARLKEMTYEYWDYHCHLVGYTKSKDPSLYADSAPNWRISNGKQQVKMTRGPTAVVGASEALVRKSSRLQAGNQSMASLSDPTCLTPGLPHKRKYESDDTSAIEQLEMQMVAGKIVDGLGSNHKTQLDGDNGQKQKQDVILVMNENKKLHDQCLVYEQMEKQLIIKAENLRRELLKFKHIHKNLVVKLELMGDVKPEKL